jgi:hypothetical protein
MLKPTVIADNNDANGQMGKKRQMNFTSAESLAMESQSHSPAHVLLRLYRMDNSFVC